MAPDDEVDEDEDEDLGAFLVWRHGKMKDGTCRLQTASPIEKSFEIDEGVSRLATWPADVAAHMDPRFPKDIGLADSLPGASFLVVSGRVKAFLEEAGVAPIEYLPLKIVNHKGRDASTDYWIVNPLAIVDCIDKGASQAKENPIDPGSLIAVKQLVLREDAVPADKQVFRLASWPSRIIIRRKLAEQMEEAGFTGLMLIEPDRYKGLS